MSHDALARRVTRVVLVLAALAFAAAVVEGLLQGLTFGVLLRWTGLFVVAALVAAAALAAVHALAGMRRARHKGERLSQGDVGLLPRVGRRDDSDARS